MKKNKYRKSLKLVNQIQKIRSKNNKNWMDLLRLSFNHNPKGAKKILKGIFVEDKRVNKLVKDLLK